MSSYSCMRDSLTELLTYYYSCDGRSTDDYYNASVVHPMAEGKYLSAMTLLQRAGLIEKGAFSRNVDTAIDRLTSTNLAEPMSDEACWGLGFPFRNAPASEPYVITTSIVCSGLLDVNSDRSNALALRAVRWLLRSAPRIDVSYRSGTLALHVFSKHIPELITNVAVSASAVMHRAGQYANGEAVSDWVRAEFSESYGWKYAPNNPRIDLLHQCYILNALADIDGVDSIGEQALHIIGLFRSSRAFVDKLSIVDCSDIAASAAHASTDCFVRINKKQWLVRNSKPARNWSIGELLLLVSRLAMSGHERHMWQVLLRRVIGIANSLIGLDLKHAKTNPEVIRFRQSMHLAHGMAAALLTLQLLRGRQEQPA